MITIHRRWWITYFIHILILSLSLFSVSSSYIPPSLLSNYGGGSSSSGASSYGSSYGSASAVNQGGSHGSQGPVTTAIESTRTVEVKPVQTMNEPHEPQVVEVPSEDMPVTVHFKSQSSRVLVQQTHTPAQIAEPEHTTSEDEPQRVIHEVVKPVIQEIREIIQPYRRLIQQVQPVIEQTHTVIAKGEPRPSVDPISVDGASTGTISGSRSTNVKFASASSNGGSSKYGSGSNYAAAASSVSLKSTSQGNPSPTSLVTETNERKPSIIRNQQPASYSLQPVTKSNSVPNQKYTQQMLKSNNAYASRRGDFREPQHMEKFDTPRISPRPSATINLKPTAQARINMKASSELASSSSLLPISETYQPRIEARNDGQIMPLSSFPHYSYSLPYHDENFSPLITFIAQPVRFRARA